ncbi:MAG: hypothetical protein AB1486_27075 [Planctomycetota bacterium]
MRPLQMLLITVLAGILWYGPLEGRTAQGLGGEGSGSGEASGEKLPKGKVAGAWLSKGIALEPELRSLEHKIVAWIVLDELSLDPEQVRALTPLLEEAALLARDQEAESQTLRAEERRAFEAFRAEAMRGQGFTEEVEGAAGRANHRAEQHRKAYLDQLAAIERQAAAVLTEEQIRRVGLRDDIVAVVQRFLGQDPARGNAPLAGGAAEGDGERGAPRARSLKAGRSGRSAIKRLRPAAGAGPVTPKETETEQEIRKELREIHREKYGEASPLGHLLASPALHEAWAARYGPHHQLVGVEEAPRSAAAVDEEARILELRREINLLNLMNGMVFTRDQLTQLAAAASKAGELMGSPDPSREELRDYEQALRRLWSCMNRREVIRTGLLHDVTRLAREVHLGKPAARSTPALGGLVSDVEELLSESQRSVLVDFKPCLIPPKNLKDPVRVGQAADRSHGVALLTRLRATPERKWRELGDFVVTRALEEIERHQGSLPAEERDAALAHLREILERARAMDDAQFELEKKDLAAELGHLNRKETLESKLRELRGDEAIVAEKVRAFILDPCFAKLASERLALGAGLEQPERVDLDTIAGAPSCKDGGCAVKD